MDASLARDARAVFDAAVAGARPDRLIARLDLDALLRRPIAAYRTVRVVGAGKAALAMAGAAESALVARGREPTGEVVVPHGYRGAVPPGVRAPAALAVAAAGHPVPDAAGVAAARRALAAAGGAGADDLLLVLLSGGGSALWPATVGDVTLDDARETARLLLRSGAPIAAMNAVRKHLSLLGGGRLAAAADPAEVLALVVSDVVGDDPSVIASGPTAPDPTTFADAARALAAHGVWDVVPARVRRHLEAGAAGAVAETVKPGAPALARARTVVVGTNGDALEAARAEARRLGYDARVVSARLDGEARDAGAAVARAALDASRAAAASGPRCLLWGGETTVTVRGDGRGGRNQELALAAALALDGANADVVVLSGGTDGVDGPTDAAGAWATPGTVGAARAVGLDPRARLDANDSHAVFHALGALVATGPTHTNVMDVVVAVVRPRPPTGGAG